MNCQKCKHPLSEHSNAGCNRTDDNGDFCSCLLTEGDVAEKQVEILRDELEHIKKWCGQDNSMITLEHLEEAIIRMCDDALEATK